MTRVRRFWLLALLVAASALAAGYDTYLRDLAYRESGNRSWVVNRYGYMGLYQMGRSALIDAGYMTSSGQWTGKNGATSQAAFLASPTIQTAAINDYNQVQWRYITRMGLDRYVGQTIGGVQITESGLLAGAHLLGAGNLATFLRSGGATVPRDGNRVPITQYIAAFGGHDLAFNGPLPDIDLATRTGPDTYTGSGYTPTYGGAIQPDVSGGGVPATDPSEAFASGSGVTEYEMSRLIAPLGSVLVLIFGAWLIHGGMMSFGAGRISAFQLGTQVMRVAVAVSALLWVFYA